MTLKIDPTRLDSEDIGEKRVELEMSHSEAIELVKKVCEKNGFGILVEFSPSEVLNKKVDADRAPYHVVGACNPESADRALKQSMRLGVLFPCNMVVWEEEPGHQIVYHLSIMKIARLLGIAPDNDEWKDIIEETGENVDSVFDELDSLT